MASIDSIPRHERCQLAKKAARTKFNREQERKLSLLDQLPRERMGTAPAKIALTENEMAWIAGFLEGEGSFGTSTPTKTGGLTQRITCRQINKEPLQRLARSLGGTLVFDMVNLKNVLSNKPISEWRCSETRARIVMQMLLSQMSKIRQDQIVLALSRNP